eukprot:3349500-Karenia_brevis.AAC.1
METGRHVHAPACRSKVALLPRGTSSLHGVPWRWHPVGIPAVLRARCTDVARDILPLLIRHAQQ